MDGHASRRPLSNRMRLGSFAAVIAAGAILVPNAVLSQSGVNVDETVLEQLRPAKDSAPQPSAALQRSDVRSDPLSSTQRNLATPPAALQRPGVGIKPTSSRRAALKEPPATMPRSRFLAPQLAPKAASQKQTARAARETTRSVKPTPRVIPPAPVTTPAAPRIAKPTSPKPPAQPRRQTAAVPAITPPPPPPAMAATGSTAPAKQMASLPAAPAAETQMPPSGDLYRLPFTGDAAALGDKNSKLLDKLADRLKRDPSLRLQLLGFANGGESASQARRVSLFRTLAVRTYLMKQGVASTRMDVRALGNRIDDAPPNRVDIQIKK